MLTVVVRYILFSPICQYPKYNNSHLSELYTFLYQQNKKLPRLRIISRAKITLSHDIDGITNLVIQIFSVCFIFNQIISCKFIPSDFV